MPRNDILAAIRAAEEQPASAEVPQRTPIRAGLTFPQPVSMTIHVDLSALAVVPRTSESIEKVVELTFVPPPGFVLTMRGADKETGYLLVVGEAQYELTDGSLHILCSRIEFIDTPILIFLHGATPCPLGPQEGCIDRECEVGYPQDALAELLIADGWTDFRQGGAA